ncbi:spore germination protein [Thermanaerosceptrum fracticalcis]|uniref:Spore germination protein n=1 Tax=Thermanaerosceptrum fracticalcis TaxID=1712410 RepID=A0A7G6E2D5_THEFR|nr:spore germination protein [Thermanaerosceptrum fracticalcis]QNB46239.1 spore germination protein [Thermanaerosceptrum fracticalcis]
MPQENKKTEKSPIPPTGFVQKLWEMSKNTLTFKAEKQREGFILLGVEDGPSKGKSQAEDNNKTKDKSRKKAGKREDPRVNKKPIRVQRLSSYNNNKGVEEKPEKRVSPENLLVDPQLKINKYYIEEIYSLPKNKDIILREFTISLKPPLKAFAVFMEGLSDKNIINDVVLKPLMILSNLEEKTDLYNLAEYIKDNILPGNQVEITNEYRKIVESVNYGGTAVFIEGSPYCLLVETKGWDRRAVGKPATEQVIRGPHEAFNETLRSNTGLVRKLIRNEKLITEMFPLGERNKTNIAIMYIEDIANPELVREVKRRINSIKTDFVAESGILEQFIEDHPLMPSPQVLSTERPDRVAAFLVEGRVAIFVDGNPNILIVPTTLFSLLHSAEDYYLRMPYGNFVRLLRVVAVFIAIMTPSIYVAIITFHQEMIPTELILAIAASRETVPFPTILEVMMMELAFELIREAGVRVPGVIGNTIGIVGALILGQAAVQAGIVSPILIIVVAVTGLASFAIPNYSLSFAFRGVRFIFTLLAAGFGFFGVSAGLFLLLTTMCSMKSFGVPMLSPIGPRTKAGPDLVLRGPMWSMEERPDSLDTLDRQRQPRVSRGWVKPKKEDQDNEQYR